MSNSISLVRGTTTNFEVDLVDANGDPLGRQDNEDLDEQGEQEDDPKSTVSLVGAQATFAMKVQTTDVANVLAYTTLANPQNLSISSLQSIISLTFLPADTASLALGSYFYQIQLLLPDGSILDVVPWSLLDLNLGGAAATLPPVFTNTTKITADYLLSGNLQYMTPGGSPIVNAQIRVYYKSDYDAGNLNAPVGITTTDAGGNWVNPILVLPGFTYTARFEKPGEFGPDTKEFFA